VHKKLLKFKAQSDADLHCAGSGGKTLNQRNILTVSLCSVASPASGDAPNRQTCDSMVGVQVGFEYELDYPDLVQIDSVVLNLTG
jgi:hypothetical protein